MGKFSTLCRMRLAMLSVFITMLLACVFLSWQIFSLHQSTESLYEHPFRVSNCTQRIKSELYKEAYMHTLLRFEKKLNGYDSLNRAISNSEVQVDSLLNVISAFYLGDRLDVIEAHSSFNMWRSTMDSYTKIPAERRTDSLSMLLETKARIQFAVTISNLDKIYSFAQNKAQSTYEDSLRKKQNGYWWSASVMIFTILLVIFLIMVLTRMITRPIQKFVAEASDLLHKDKPVHRLQDHALMMATLEELKETYRKIEHQKQEIEERNIQLTVLNEELESTVRERTSQLKKSNDYLENLFHYANAPIIVWDQDFMITRLNPAFEYLTGRKSSEVVGKSVSILFPPEKMQSSMDVLKEIFEGKQMQTEEIEIAHVDGTVRTVLWNSAVVREDENTVAAIAQGQDISKRVLLEMALKIQNRISHLFLTCTDDSLYHEVLKLVLQEMKSPYGIFGYLDDDGALVIPSMNELVIDKGPVPEKAIRFPSDKWTDSSWARAIREMRPAFSNEIALKTPLGHAEIRRHIAFPVIMQSRVIALIVVANKADDYTEEDLGLLETIAGIIAPVLDARIKHDLFEKQRAEMFIALERSNKELEQFAYIASHDLQEPLRMISSYTQLLSRRYKGRLDNDADDFIQYAAGGAERMQKLINDLLEYSRLNTRKSPMSLVNCHNVLGHVRSNLSLMLEEEHALLTCGELPEVVGDETQLVQLFQNLIGNAVKYHRDVPPHVHVAAEEKDDEWVFSVRDNGIGIAPEFFERIFGIFQRLHSRYEYSGTGIGLAICKKIVERHGGTIWLESVPGEGSTFYFSLSKYQ